jgi:hypothetical protein
MPIGIRETHHQVDLGETMNAIPGGTPPLRVACQLPPGARRAFRNSIFLVLHGLGKTKGRTEHRISKMQKVRLWVEGRDPEHPHNRSRKALLSNGEMPTRDTRRLVRLPRDGKKSKSSAPHQLIQRRPDEFPPRRFTVHAQFTLLAPDQER